MTRDDFIYTAYVTRDGRVLCYTPKAGSSNIHGHGKGALKMELGRQTRHQAMTYREDGAQVVLFVREPMARLRSAWQFWVHETPVKPYVPATWEEFVDEVLDGRYEPHWSPQFEWHTSDDGVFIPNQAMKLEYMPRWFKLVYGIDLEVENRSIRREIDTTYRAHELLVMYSTDLALWEAAYHGGG
jgi:hypothetical protein